MKHNIKSENINLNQGVKPFVGGDYNPGLEISNFGTRL